MTHTTEKLDRYGRKSLSCACAWGRAMHALGLQPRVDRDGYISLRFWPEVWAGIWAALVAANGEPDTTADEVREVDLVIIRPIERALAEAGHGDLPDQVAATLGIADKVERFRALRSQYEPPPAIPDT